MTKKEIGIVDLLYVFCNIYVNFMRNAQKFSKCLYSKRILKKDLQ